MDNEQGAKYQTAYIPFRNSLPTTTSPKQTAVEKTINRTPPPPPHTRCIVVGSLHNFIIASWRRRHYPGPLDKGINSQPCNLLCKRVGKAPLDAMIKFFRQLDRTTDR